MSAARSWQQLLNAKREDSWHPRHSAGILTAVSYLSDSPVVRTVDAAMTTTPRAASGDAAR